MAVSFVGAGTAISLKASNNALNGNRAIPVPTGTAASDVMLLMVVANMASTTFSAPSQWNLVETGQTNGQGRYALYWARGNITPGNLTYSIEYAGVLYARVLGYRGVSASTNPPWENYTASDASFNNTTPVPITTPAIAVSANGGAVVTVSLWQSSWSNAFNPPSGWNERVDVTLSQQAFVNAYAADYLATSKGTVASAKFPATTSGGNSDGLGRLFTFALIADDGSTPSKGTINVNVGGTWKQAQSLWVNSAGTWKQAQSVFTNVGGTWKQVL